jgi:hypothetical protein
MWCHNRIHLTHAGAGTTTPQKGLTMDAQTQQDTRLAISRQVDAIMGFEGHQPSLEERNIVRRWVAGEIDDETLSQLINNYAHSLIK